jgi:GT2 family glycosyltransferase
MANKNNVWAVVPNWNGADLLAGCLRSLQAQSYPANLVVVDNGSIDESIELLEKEFPAVQLIKLPENRGFAGGVNAGIRYALEQGAEAIALFNNDAVADKSWLENLVRALEANEQCGIATGKLMRSDKLHIDSTGEQYSAWGMPFPRGRNQKDAGQFDKAEPVFGATGGASLYRAAALGQVGLFDERFFAYYEDVDISFRMQLAGWKILYEPRAVAYHQVGATSSKHGNFTRYHATKNFYLLYLKNMPGWLFWKYLIFFKLYALRLAGGSLVKGHFLTFMRSTLAALMLFPYAMKERSRIQKTRKVSPAYVAGLLFKGRPPKTPRI